MTPQSNPIALAALKVARRFGEEIFHLTPELEFEEAPDPAESDPCLRLEQEAPDE